MYKKTAEPLDGPTPKHGLGDMKAYLCMLSPQEIPRPSKGKGRFNDLLEQSLMRDALTQQEDSNRQMYYMDMTSNWIKRSTPKQGRHFRKVSTKGVT